jgi:hypothetical protein
VLLVWLLVFCGAICCSAQSQPQTPLPPLLGQQQSQEEKKQQDAWEHQRKQEATRKENLEREQEIKKDTDQLLALATELKQYVDKSNENTMSLDVIKKAEQIEKLAKTVRQKMKGSS